MENENPPDRTEPFYDYADSRKPTGTTRKVSRSKIATTFWGLSWIDNLEQYHDYERRMPLGKSCMRAGGVLHLDITTGLIFARVMDDGTHEVHIRIAPLEDTRWQTLVKKCAGEVLSLTDLMSGKLSHGVLLALTNHDSGVFPMPTEVKMTCSCIDDASVCKHVAATLYAVGQHLDKEPLLFFELRSIKQADLIANASSQLSESLSSDAIPAGGSLAADEMAKIFGVEFDLSEAPLG